MLLERGGGGALKVLWWQGATLLNPHFAVGTKDQEGSRIFYEPLAAWDGDGNLVPVRGGVLVRGVRAPIVGRVCMDQTMIDVTDIAGVREGDEVVLIGRQGAEEIRAEDVGEKLGTNNYETVTTISARMERRYV